MIKCIYCGKQFEQRRSWQKFCGAVCRLKNWDKNNPRIKKGGDNEKR